MMCYHCDDIYPATAYTAVGLPRKMKLVKAKFSFDAGAQDELTFLVCVSFVRLSTSMRCLLGRRGV